MGRRSRRRRDGEVAVGWGAAQVSEEQVRAVFASYGSTPRTITQETLDIYLLPPNEDPETCQTWLRMRSRDGKYSLMFEEFVTDDQFIISPRVTFEVRRARRRSPPPAPLPPPSLMFEEFVTDDRFILPPRITFEVHEFTGRGPPPAPLPPPSRPLDTIPNLTETPSVFKLVSI